MGLLTTAQILGAQRATKQVEIPALGGHMRLRELSVGQMSKWLADNAADLPYRNGRLIVMSVVDKDDALLFAPDQASLFEDLSYHACEQILAQILRMNRLNAGATEELKKSSATPGGDSPIA